MRKITFDLETKNFFHEVNSNDPAALDISVICIHDSLDDEYKSFFEKDFNKLWPILESADLLISWNGDHFDIPILNKYYPGDLTQLKSLDLMKEVQKVLGRRLKLDSVGEATLGINKSAHGSQAVEWWRAGKLDELVKYCIDYVRLTKDLYDYALINKHVKYKELGSLKKIPLNTTFWEVAEPVAMTHTLPF